MPASGKGGDVTPDEPTYERVPTDELARLRRIEEAARELLNRSQGRRSASQLLTAMAALRVALKETPERTSGE
jgi:hypothetical protein